LDETAARDSPAFNRGTHPTSDQEDSAPQRSAAEKEGVAEAATGRDAVRTTGNRRLEREPDTIGDGERNEDPAR
jgi:hypothetical protein